MSGPKHLWSGDWESESARAAAERAEQPVPVAVEPPAVELEPTPRRLRPRQLLLAFVAGLLVVGVAVALAVSLGGSSKKPTQPPAHTQTLPNPPATQTQAVPGASGGSTPAQSNPAPVTSGPSTNWLGMHIVSSPLGAVVDTVPGNSVGDTAGFEPGDVITEIGGDAINSVQEIRTATQAIQLGKLVSITISRGSSTLTTTVTLKVRPTIRP
jgi:membrane-associated protease RseP (regulator of RpoE activity)